MLRCAPPRGIVVGQLVNTDCRFQLHAAGISARPDPHVSKTILSNNSCQRYTESRICGVTHTRLKWDSGSGRLVKFALIVDL